ncbi:MAG: ATP-binding protein, partial [Myxococcota bacterium]
MSTWWKAPKFADADLTRRASVVYPIIVIVTVAFVVFGLAAASTGRVPLFYAPIAVGVGLAFGAAGYAVRRGHVTLGAGVVVTALAADGLIPMLDTGLMAPSFTTFVLVMVIAAATLDLRFVLGLGVVGLAFVAMVAYAVESGVIVPTPLSPSLQFQTRIGQILLALLVVWLTTPSWQRWISELRDRESDVRQSRKQYVELVQQSPAAVIQLDDEGVVQLVNPVGERLLGPTTETLVGQPVEILEPASPRVVQLLNDVRRRTVGEAQVSARVELVHPDGSARTVAATASRFDGGVIATLVDVTDTERARRLRADLEQRHGHAQKMEALGRLAGGIAHDFNNLLTVITSGAALVEDDSPSLTDSATDDLRAVQEAARQAADLTGQLLAFGRRQALDRRRVDAHEIVRSVARLMDRTLGEAVTLDVRISGEPHAVLADASQLERVFVNLITNARDALAGPGCITIGVRPDPTDADWLEFFVEDDGQGMDEATRARIFEPFFTTKAPGRGTGLGLATVHGVVNQLGGQVTVSSTLGVGTVFRLRLPRADPAGAVPAPSAERPGVREGPRLRILLVEDEDAVREMLGRGLERGGHAVVTARGVEDGIAAAGRTDDIDMLVTDVILGDGTGPELAGRLATRGFAGSVLFVTGLPQHVARVA